MALFLSAAAQASKKSQAEQSSEAAKARFEEEAAFCGTAFPPNRAR